MKKNLFLATLLILIMSACIFTACASTKCGDTHTWRDGEITKPATCDTTGEMIQKCSVCNKTRELPVEATGHKYGKWTANADGLTHSRVCENNNAHVQTAGHSDLDANGICDACSYELTVLPIECVHEWSQWTDNGDGTCTRICQLDNSHVDTADHIDSDENELCDNCGADLHICEWLDWESNGDGTHTRVCATNEDHTETEDCSGGEADCYNGACCDYCYEEYTDALGHLWGEWESNEDGTHGRICSRDPEDEHYDEEDCAYTEVSRTPATCEDAEIITYECGVCGYSYTEEGDSELGHLWGEWESNGEGIHARVCKYDPEHYDEADCNYVEIERVEADCENDGYITYQCDVCGHSYKETIDAIGHAYGEWVSDNSGKSTKTCANDENHTITETFIPSCSIDLSEGIILNYYVAEELLEDKSNIRIEFVRPDYDADGNKITTTTIVDTFEEVVNNGSLYLQFSYKDLAASEMNTVVSANLYCGDEYLSTRDFSVKSYAMKYLAASANDALFNTLLVDMLNYGAAAQSYFGYETDNLANADLTEAQKAYATQTTPEINKTTVVERNPDGLVEAKGGSVSLMSVIQISFGFILEGVDIENVEVIFDYVDRDGNAQQTVIDGADATSYPDMNRYSVIFNKYGTTQLRDNITMSFRDKTTGEMIGDRSTTSIESNLAALLEKPEISEELRELIIALMKFGDSATAYFSARA